MHAFVPVQELLCLLGLNPYDKKPALLRKKELPNSCASLRFSIKWEKEESCVSIDHKSLTYLLTDGFSCGPVGTGSYSLRFGKDPEPGRCRRTDGKKWRCSRDAAPDQKYCERHLNRGRPRSRKPVEVSSSVSPNKKNRHCHGSNAPLPSTSAGFSSAIESHHHHNHHAAPMFFQGTGGFEPVAAANNKEGR